MKVNIFKYQILICLLSCLGILQGCTNNFIAAVRSTSLSSVNVPNPTTAANPNSASSPLTLSQVLPDTQNPTTVFDLVGDGTGAMTQYCTWVGGASPSSSSGSGSGASATSTCACSYSYTNTDGSTVSFEMPTIYIEANMIRCQATGIPSSISYVTVKIHLTNSDSYTNSINYNIGSGGSSLDTSNTASFLLAQRFQCKDIVWIPYLLDPGNATSSKMYDPFQSDNPHLTYPFNFYTTNLGGAISAYAASSSNNYWNCPAIPNDTNAGMNLTVYSEAPDTSGSKLIYPASGSVFDRSTFYLAKSPSGVFTVPVNAYIAPNVLTAAQASATPYPSSSPEASPGSSSSTSGPPPPMGYGAAPVATGTSSETCPTTTIPSGYHWVKIWLFRASIAARNYLYSTELQQLGAVSCNPGMWTNGQAIYAGCGASQPLDDTLGAKPLATRILGTRMCIDLEEYSVPVTKIAGGTTQNNGSLFGAFAGYGFRPGSDYWAPAAASIYSCGGSSQLDPMHICSTIPGTAITVFTPYSSTFSLAPIDQTSRYDFLFVVSPVNVMASDMKSGSNTSNIYTPYRFMASTDCQSADPDNPSTAGDCSINHKITYGIKWHDVGLNGDPPASDPNRAGTFPICALQPD